MNGPPRNGNGHIRTDSLSISTRDVPPPVIAHKRNSSLSQRPPLAATTATPPTTTMAASTATAATRSASTTRAKKTAAAKPPAGPAVSAVAKRRAAKTTSLRTRMPYLRPGAATTATASAEASTQLPPRPPPRSFSSSASTHGAAPWLKASYTAIPEALQQVKKICAASKDASDKESAAVVLRSANARERRLSRPPSVPAGGRGGDVNEEAATVIQNVEVVQGMLFSSLQTTVAVEALTPLSPQRVESATSHFHRSKSCNSQLESPLISPASGLFLSRKDRQKAWALLLHKRTHAFPTLVNAARSPLATREPRVSAALLTFLYNVLRHMAGERQRKAVLLCEKLGLVRVCTAVLQDSRRRLRFEAASTATRAPCLRACEATGLLFTLVHTFNAKLSAAFRLSQSLDCTLGCATAAFAVLETEFVSFQQTVHPDGPGQSMREAIKAHADAHTRKDTLKLLHGFQTRVQWAVTAFSHFCFTLFVFSGTAASGKEVGAHGAELCATAIAMTTYFLSQVAPVLLTNVVYDRSEDTLHPAVGPLVTVDHGHWAPAWVVKLLRHVELQLLWCVALLHRLGGYDGVGSAVAERALAAHVPRGCLLFLAPPALKEAVQLAPRRECVHVMLLLLNTLLDADRAGTLTDLSGFGGLKSLVTSVLALSEPAAQQWHHYYVQLATMYGCLQLPTIAGHAPCYVDQRLPDSLRRLCPATDGTGPAEVGINGGCAAGTALGTHSAAQVNTTAGLPLQPSPCEATLSLDENPNASHRDAGGVSSPTNTSATQSLSPAEKFVSASDAVLSPPPALPTAACGDLKDGLLLVDTHPSLFSPELHDGIVDPAAALSDFTEATQLPWAFTALAPSTTAEYWQGRSSHVKSVVEDDHLHLPLKEVPQEDRVRVLRHHIGRLARLDETACDATANPHVYTVVFERRSSASPQAAAAIDAAVQPSHDGIEFFSDFEGGNLQRAVAVADNEFDLVLAWDTATNSYTQWFNFGVRHYTPGKTYHFNILNMEKLGSTFNDGQKPLMLHVPDSDSPNKETTKRRAAQWQRVGHNIFYFRNTYERPARAHLFSKDAQVGNGGDGVGGGSGIGGPAAGSTTSLAGSITVAAGGTASAHTTPTTSAPLPRCSPVRSTGCNPAPRLSPSRTPPTPPPVVAKRRAPVSTGTSPAARNLSTNNTANNGRSNDDGDDGGTKQKNYFTMTFSVTMPSEGAGRVYFANCFPFSYTELRQHVSWLLAQTEKPPVTPHHGPAHVLRAQSLCVTPGGLEVPLLTVTALRRRDGAEAFTSEEIRRRPIALLVARVHPGETNASWVMQGLLDALLRPTAAMAAWSVLLCETFVFKVVPMLNVDGVMMGNHRCSFAGMDMNRDYLEPKAELDPTLYAMKQLLRYWRQEEGRQTVLFADFHGHSRAKNFLLYGCTSETMRGVASHLGGADKKAKGRGGGGRRRRVRVRQTSTDAPLGPEKLLASLLNHVFPSFSLSQSSYAVTKDKVSSARVVLYDEFGVRMSYGFEATMVGGRISVPELVLPLAETPNTGGMLWKEEVHYSPVVFRAMGDAFIRAIAILSEQWLTTTSAATAARDSNASNSSSSSSSADKLVRSSGAVEALQAVWSATAAAGSGRDAPKGRLEEIAKEAAPVEPRAGPYATATRGDRRHGHAVAAAAAAAASSPVSSRDAATLPSLPAVSAAGQLDALNYLFLVDQREAVVQGDDDDDGTDQRTVDGSEVSSVVGESDGEPADATAKKPAIAETKKRGGDSDGDGSPSAASSDSGSDDHNWDGFDSSASSVCDDLAVERSSASSVDDDIPANLFT